MAASTCLRKLVLYRMRAAARTPLRRWQDVLWPTTLGKPLQRLHQGVLGIRRHTDACLAREKKSPDAVRQLLADAADGLRLPRVSARAFEIRRFGVCRSQ